MLQTPFIRPLLALLAGILSYIFLPYSQLYFSIGFASACLLAYHLTRPSLEFKHRWINGLLILACVYGLGGYSKYIIDTKYETALPDSGVYYAEVIENPTEKTNSYQLYVQTISHAADSTHFKSHKQKLVLYTEKSAEANRLEIGSKLLFSGRLTALTPSNNPEAFDYNVYLKRKGYNASGFIKTEQWQNTNERPSFSLKRTAIDYKNYIINYFREIGFSGNELGVLSALTIGDKDEISAELYQQYSVSGAMHILAVSGQHIGIIYIILLFSLSFLNKTKFTRVLQSIIIILLLWLYAYVTGLSASVVRAVCMFSIISAAGVFNQKQEIYNTIFLSAFLLLLINPNYIFDVGLLLSYVAVISIVYFYPLLRNLYFPNNKFMKWCWELTAMSCAAQIGTFPIAIYFFGQFSNYFIITNLLIIPLATLIIYLALVLLLTQSIPFISGLLVVAIKYLLQFQNKLVSFIESLPHSASQFWVNGLDVLLLYLFISYTVLFLLKKQAKHIQLALIFLCCICTQHIVYKLVFEQQEMLIVYAQHKSSAIEYISGNEHFVYTDDSVKTKRLAANLWRKRGLTDSACFYNLKAECFKNKRVLFLNDSELKRKTANTKLTLDYLIISNKSKLNSNEIFELFEPKNIIIDNTYSPYKATAIIEECESRKIHCHYTKEKGAFLLNL